MLILSPQARAIAAFTVAVALLIGQLNRITFGVILVFGNSLPSGRGGALVITVVQLLVAATVMFAALVVARAASVGWSADLAQAAVIVAGLGFAITVVVGVGNIAHGTGGLPSGAFSAMY